MLMLLLGACAPTSDSASGPDTADSGASPVTSYLVDWWTDPTPAEAAVPTQFYEHITDQDGNSLDDLQASHQRYVHTVFVSRDLASFTHTHMEDFTNPVPTAAIRTSTFDFPVTFPYSGDYLVVFDYARADQWLQTEDMLAVGGSVPQLDAPAEDFATTVMSGAVTVALSWDVVPVPGFEAEFTLHVTDTAGGDVADLVQWLGADAHCVIVDEGLGFAGHTHAWFPGMESMTPTMTMPHVYAGPDLPFHFVFPVAGVYKRWAQFVRESEPDKVYAVPFMFTVTG